MEHILLALEMAPSDTVVLNKALALARATGARLSMLHVAAPEPDFVGFEVGPTYIRDHLATTLRSDHRHIQSLAEQAEKAGVEAIGRLVQGPTVETLLQEAAELPADLIVLGSHGHGALYKAFLGSVSDGILRARQFPVLIVPVNDTDA
ncbi:MAG: universal stress protein [Flavobacteriales bacterium]